MLTGIGKRLAIPEEGQGGEFSDIPLLLGIVDVVCHHKLYSEIVGVVVDVLQLLQYRIALLAVLRSWKIKSVISRREFINEMRFPTEEHNNIFVFLNHVV